MGRITSFDIPTWIQKDLEYCQMKTAIEHRILEIYEEFGDTDECWHIVSFEIYDDSDDDGEAFWIDIQLENASGKTTRRSMDAKWLFEGGYEDKAKRARDAKEAMIREFEYEEYLRLKKKFESQGKEHKQ